MSEQNLALSIRNDPEIKDLVKKIKDKITHHPISDLEDDAHHQYVDLVLEGGGVLGIALVGYTYAMEQAGIRFLNIAGTSAGAINAMFLATLGSVSDIKSNRMIELLAEMPMESFIDAEPIYKKVLFDYINHKKTPSLKSLKTWWLLIRLYCKVKKGDVSFNSGNPFESWLEEKIPFSNSRDLFDHLKNSKDFLKIRETAVRDYKHPITGFEFTREYDLERIPKDFAKNKLVLVTADITTSSKVLLPEMASLYWENHLMLHPAKYVRASMSIPVFFEPVKVNPPQILEKRKLWQNYLGYIGEIPHKVSLVDGGIVSNFPIDVFHNCNHIPLCPTFGIKLGVDRQEPNKYKDLLNFAGLVFDTARQTADYNFIFQNKDYRQLITYVDLEGDESYKFNWLEFNMDHDKKLALFKLGVKAAYNFIVSGNQKIHLKSFNWLSYKKVREQLLSSLVVSG